MEKKHAEAASQAMLHPQQEDLKRRVADTKRHWALAAIRSKGSLAGQLIGLALAAFLYFKLHISFLTGFCIVVFFGIVGAVVSEQRARARQRHGA